jgi:Protein phosphatase 2C
MNWRIAATSAIGTSHIKNDQPCQDSVSVRLKQTSTGPMLISAVSDGAGSAARSEIGSRAAVTTATYLIENFLDAGGAIGSIGRNTVLSWLAQIQSVISTFATESGVSTREFACTLLVAVVGAESAVFFQVGDGAMVVREENDEGWSYIFWPQHGEYINSTNFITTNNAAEILEFAFVSRRIESFSAFSDGIESLVLHYATKTVHDPFFNNMIAPVRETLKEGIDEELSNSLLNYLNSERVCSRTDDDKSLVLATRYEPHILSANAAS